MVCTPGTCLLFAAVFVFLGYLGGTPQEAWKITASQIATIMYFGFFVLVVYLQQKRTDYSSTSKDHRMKKVIFVLCLLFPMVAIAAGAVSILLIKLNTI